MDFFLKFDDILNQSELFARASFLCHRADQAVNCLDSAVDLEGKRAPLRGGWNNRRKICLLLRKMPNCIRNWSLLDGSRCKFHTTNKLSDCQQYQGDSWKHRTTVHHPILLPRRRFLRWTKQWNSSLSDRVGRNDWNVWKWVTINLRNKL